MRVAIVHYWLVGMRGGEKVVEALCTMFPEADIFTHVVDKSRISRKIRDRVKGTTLVGRLPFAKHLYKYYLPLMPWALEQLDLRAYDLVISSESGPAKNILVCASATHVCYCHSPMRYIWELYHGYLSTARGARRLGLQVFAHYLRMTDTMAAARVDHFVANSYCVAQRIKRSYNRDATVIYPPVETHTFHEPRAQFPRGDNEQGFYLMVGELVDYKRFDLGIAACSLLKRKLVIVGSGEARKRLVRSAGPNILFRGSIPTSELQRLYATCHALIFPGEEDFGIVPVEAMASGRPVIAYRKGGAVESVKDGVSGLFFAQQNVSALCDAILDFECREWDSNVIKAHAEKFGIERFLVEMRSLLERLLPSRNEVHLTKKLSQELEYQSLSPSPSVAAE